MTDYRMPTARDWRLAIALDAITGEPDLEPLLIEHRDPDELGAALCSDVASLAHRRHRDILEILLAIEPVSVSHLISELSGAVVHLHLWARAGGAA